MGLDVSHECWHGAYSAFSRWRNKLAEVAGYQIAKVDFGPGSFGPSDTILIDWGHIAEECFQGTWTETPADPLIVLFAHSDCDGWIHPPQAVPLADRLEELLPLLPDEDGAGHIGNWRNKTQLFITGLREAAAAGESVEFA